MSGIRLSEGLNKSIQDLSAHAESGTGLDSVSPNRVRVHSIRGSAIHGRGNRRPRQRCLGGLLVCGMALAACAPAPDMAQQKARPAVPERDLLAEVRASARDAGDVIDVQPLRDPGLDDLLASAQSAEARRDFDAAARDLQQALQIQANDPEILQRHAEIQLALNAFDEAERFASLSYERGPRLGSLCRRNWTTVRLAREIRGDASGAERAARQVSECVVAPPVRM